MDTNVVAYLMIPGDHTEAAAALFARDPDWIVPSLWRSEFRNLLVLYIRRGQLALDDALVLMARGEVLLGARERRGALGARAAAGGGVRLHRA